MHKLLIRLSTLTEKEGMFNFTHHHLQFSTNKYRLYTN